MSTRILAFNTATQLCSVAVMIDQNIYDYNIIASKCHSKKILPMIHQLLAEVGISLKSLDCIVFDRGPGSFVGVRIGISIAQGLALGADLPLVEVSSLAVLAQGAWRLFSAKQVIATIDARMGELYWALYCYQVIDNIWLLQGDECLMIGMDSRKLICTLQNNWVLVGTGWNNYPGLTYINTNDPIILRSIMLPEAHDMLLLGINNWNNKILITPNKVQPVYLRNKAAI